MAFGPYRRSTHENSYFLRTLGPPIHERNRYYKRNGHCWVRAKSHGFGKSGVLIAFCVTVALFVRHIPDFQT
jgi:hypothetical protein